MFPENRKMVGRRNMSESRRSNNILDVKPAFSETMPPPQSLVHLHNVDEYPVADEPHQNVDEEDGDGVPPEEEGRRPRRHQTQQHALRDGLEEHRHRRRCHVQLPPPESERERIVREGYGSTSEITKCLITSRQIISRKCHEVTSNVYSRVLCILPPLSSMMRSSQNVYS